MGWGSPKATGKDSPPGSLIEVPQVASLNKNGCSVEKDWALREVRGTKGWPEAHLQRARSSDTGAVARLATSLRAEWKFEMIL